MGAWPEVRLPDTSQAISTTTTFGEGRFHLSGSNGLWSCDLHSCKAPWFGI